jgi:hypothetical protein
VPEYLSPGVYVEEVDRGPKPIEGVGTSTAVFIGFTEKAQALETVDGETVVRDLLGKAQFVTNWSQYLQSFGSFVDGAYLPLSVYGFFQNGGQRCYVLSVKTMPKAQAGLLNGEGKAQLVVRSRVAGDAGRRLRVKVSGGAIAAPAAAAPKRGEKKDDTAPAADAAPAAPAASSGDGSGAFTITVERQKLSGGWEVKETVREAMLNEVDVDGVKRAGVAYKDNRAPQWIEIEVPQGQALAKLTPREQEQSLNIDAGLLMSPAAKDFQGDVAERTGMEGLEAIEDINIICIPDLMTPMPGQKLDLQTVKAVQIAAIAHAERVGNRVVVLDAPPDLTPQAVAKWRKDSGFDSSYAALYYPWLQVSDPATNRVINVPASGYVAGVWARSDTTRGVHKAPANEVVQGAMGLAYGVTKGEQDILNPIGVNCIRAMPPTMGIRVWGARTLSGNPSWKYINVRRLFNFVEKSIENSTQWTVFEPNDQVLWGQIKRDVNAFLTEVWRSGALFGQSPSQAFYVKCDEELNPSSSRDLGRLIIEIGMSPVKPAEFVIFRISQWAGTS